MFHQHYVFLVGSPNGLSLERKILPEYLKDLGYSTHIVGKYDHHSALFVPGT